MRSVRSVLVAACLSLAPTSVLADQTHPDHVPATAAGADLQQYVEGASRLEGRILAPCCWNQTIDIHGSEPAYQLRSEIRNRLKAGETPEAIEASFVKRYGTKILAVPDSSPLGGIAALLAVGFGAAGVAAYFMLKRWSKLGKASERKGAPPRGNKRDALDERLDRELAEIAD